jgi:hypothetical protein
LGRRRPRRAAYRSVAAAEVAVERAAALDAFGSPLVLSRVTWFQIKKPDSNLRPTMDLGQLEPFGHSETVEYAGQLEDACNRCSYFLP